MNNQQKAQAHKRQYKKKARDNRAMSRALRLFPSMGGVCIDLPVTSNTNWALTDFGTTATDTGAADRIVKSMDDVTNGLFSQHFNKQKEGQHG
jgi:hypothetical protein